MTAAVDLERGAYVRNIHPCNAGRMPDGIVTGTVDELGMLSVAVGTGSHVYGPAAHWTRIDRQPDWSTPARLAEAAYWRARREENNRTA